MKVDANFCHDRLRDTLTPHLSFENYGGHFAEWRQKVREKFIELFGLDNIAANACPLHFDLERTVQKEGYSQTRFTIETEKGSVMPVYILIPDDGREKYPVAITLQGHSTGFHNSIGEPKNESEREYATGRGQFAVQAVRHGYIAVAAEQRGMGERRPDINDRAGLNCTYEAMTALNLGRTILGERVYDVSRLIDALSYFPQCDLTDITVTGNSGGGTASFYAACFDERITLSAPSCAFCSYRSSIMDILHCACNYVPHSYEYFEMSDLSCLIAPRKLLVTAGKKDDIFPIEGARSAFETVRKVYAAAGADGNCKLVETEKDHWWCEDVVWKNIAEMRGKAGA